MITITIDTTDFSRKLADFPEALARARRVALKKVGNIVKNHARDAIKGKAERPRAWEPRKPSKNDDGHPLLLKSTNMWNSIDDRVVGDDTVVIGTPAKYASYHQKGTKNIPAGESRSV